MHKFGAGLMTFVVSLILVVSTLTVSFSLLLTPWPTQAFAYIFADESTSGFTHAEMVSVAEGVLAYSLGDDNADLPTGDDYTVAIDESALSHLRDVRSLFQGMIIVAIASTILSLLMSTILLATHRRKMLGRSLYLAVALLAAVVIVAAIYAILDFSTFFNFLHGFFFSSGSWYFPVDSLLISALPTPFWAAMGVLWGVLALLLCLMMLFAGKRFVRSRS